MQQSQKDDITAQSKWERESSDEDEQLTEEEKKKKEEFRQWRKAHYNEYAAVQRARQLIQVGR
jgi:protein phosphatase inhibitor 2